MEVRNGYRKVTSSPREIIMNKWERGLFIVLSFSRTDWVVCGVALFASASQPEEGRNYRLHRLPHEAYLLNSPRFKREKARVAHCSTNAAGPSAARLEALW